MAKITALGLLSLVASACSSPTPRSFTTPTSNPDTIAAGSAATTTTTVAAADVAVTTIALGQPLLPGHVRFTGMLVPTKGGYRVGEAIVDGAMLTAALPPPASGAVIDSEGFVGANLQVTGVLEQVDSSTAVSAEGLPRQTRAGSWWALRRIDAVAIASPAVMIEGTLSPSKGFFSLDKYLINRSDLAWALAPNGGKAGEQYRVWGQPSVVTCAPNAQCLLGGQLPIFVVGRAQRLTN